MSDRTHPEITDDLAAADHAAEPGCAQDDDAPTEAYWMLVEAGKMWAEACNYFGNPRDMFRHPFMRARQRAIIADWVRCLEMLVRRIILMVAIKLELAPSKPRALSTNAAREAKPRRPFTALRPTLIIMPAVGQRRPRLPIHAHIYARRTAFSLARIAQRHRGKPHPIIALSPWAIHEEKLTSGQAAMYDQIAHAQALCLDQLDLWHARMPEPG